MLEASGYKLTNRDWQQLQIEKATLTQLLPSAPLITQMEVTKKTPEKVTLNPEKGNSEDGTFHHMKCWLLGSLLKLGSKASLLPISG